jgi:hypothetical protein
MTVYFFDSSALVKRYVTETGTPWVRAVTLPSAGHRIFIAYITPVETVSALARRKRDGNIAARTSRAARLVVDRHTLREYDVVQLSRLVIQRAEDLAEAYPLRAGDALQLASALEVQVKLAAANLPPLVFVSADVRLLTVAVSEGLPTHQPV